MLGWCPLIWGSISKNAIIFWNILGSTYWLQFIQKNNTMNFCLFIYLQSCNNKSKLSFLQRLQSRIKVQHFLFANEQFLCKMLVCFFIFNIPLYIEKNVENKVLEMELIMCTPICPKFIFEKVRFKVFHYIQHDLIH